MVVVLVVVVVEVQLHLYIKEILRIRYNSYTSDVLHVATLQCIVHIHVDAKLAPTTAHTLVKLCYIAVFFLYL